MIDYDARKDAAESYDAALKAIRMEKIKAGEINPIVREVTIGDCRLIQGDCLEVMGTLGKVDAVVTDPPYGIGEDGSKAVTRCGPASFGAAYVRDYGAKGWDDSTLDAEVSAAIAIAKHSIIFGGNYYSLPPTSCWLVWDKKNQGTDFADCELAWTNLKKAVRKIDFLWSGGIRRERHIPRQHPTQKPIGVMEWCIGHLPSNAQTILDPFMGSGTTLVACAKMGRKGIGIELDPDYFDIAVERVRKAYEQPDFFIEQSKQPEPQQEDMGL